MKALTIIEPNLVQVVDKEIPEMSSEDVLLRVRYVGFCGSDLSTYLGRNPMVKYPRIPGHEISAVVVDCGESVPKKFQVGQSVTVIPYTHCGKCSSCRKYRFNACQFNETLGVQRDGAMTEFLVVHWKKVLIADGLSDLELAMVEPLTVGFHAVDRGRVTDSDTVMVMGCGMIGLGAVIGAAVRGANIIAVDLDDEKLAIAQRLGASLLINSRRENLSEKLREYTNGGPDVVVEAVGSTTTYVAAVNEVAFSGRIVCIGYAKEEVSFATKLFVQKELDILGARNATPADFQAVIDYLTANKIPIEYLLSKYVSFVDSPAAFECWARNPQETVKMMFQIE